ncbi:hypothetical protein GP486_006631 [Trichoglossum hirsutum]|uniref:Uncharacterized protein n=1 Tax=Trichoglossum hirsutum TaxID=265104 RepID=A0A9P8I7S3_9PEZI|nr:hypothetical protein GP486_006631 [Trichoglossum hirsutum]
MGAANEEEAQSAWEQALERDTASLRAGNLAGRILDPKDPKECTYLRRLVYYRKDKGLPWAEVALRLGVTNSGNLTYRLEHAMGRLLWSSGAHGAEWDSPDQEFLDQMLEEERAYKPPPPPPQQEKRSRKRKSRR